MQLVNETPFSPFVFGSVDPHDRPIHCVFCRGTFDVVADGRLHLAAEQQPVVLADRYRYEPLTSSIEVDTDLVPERIAADITLNATAHAPEGMELESWLVSVNIGKVSKQVQVCGPRHWQHSLVKGWHLSRPTPIHNLPLHYELAFGGRQIIDSEVHLFDENPVGRGFLVRKQVRLSDTIPAPQIEDPQEPVREFGRIYRPVGVGPIAKHWLPRRSLCGTADESWKESRWPLRPMDFDFRYYNCAPPGLVYPGFLRGDEEVVISGCSTEGPVRFELPHLSVVMVAVETNFKVVPREMVLDTLFIDLNLRKVFLTWRSTFAKSGELSSLHLASCSI